MYLTRYKRKNVSLTGCRLGTLILQTMEKMKQFFEINKQESRNSSFLEDGKAGKVPIHSLTQHPTQAWKQLKVKQTVKELKLLDPTTPMSEDKIRFVCLSDTHGMTEKLKNFVPAGDVILHAGDFTQVGAPKEINTFDSFLGSLPHKVKVVIAGNHDLSLDKNMTPQPHGHDYVTEEMNFKSCRALLRHCIYLFDSTLDVCGIKIYGTPWQPRFGDWAFNLTRGAPCLEKWDQIPEDTDILITHGPPIGHGDLCEGGYRAGCVELLTTVQTRVKPKYHLFGHIHEGYGVTTDGQTIFINASNCTLQYKSDNRPIVFDFPIPEGHTKAELDKLPTNNLDEHN